LCGFDFGQRRLKNSPTTATTFWTFPYWSVILPLTLLSAYLILVPFLGRAAANDFIDGKLRSAH